jgi:hypothetical protein
MSRPRADQDLAVAASTAAFTGAFPALNSPAWTEVRGEVTEVNHAKKRLKVKQESDGIVKSLSVDGQVAIYDVNMNAVPFQRVKKGQSVVVQNHATAPAGAAQ